MLTPKFPAIQLTRFQISPEAPLCFRCGDMFNKPERIRPGVRENLVCRVAPDRNHPCLTFSMKVKLSPPIPLRGTGGEFGRQAIRTFVWQPLHNVLRLTHMR